MNWHDSVGFVRLLQKGVPSAVEALASEPLYSSPEWDELKKKLEA